MAKSYVGPGDIIPLIAPAGGVLAGNGVIVEVGFYVAEAPAAAGESFLGRRVGEVRLPKVAATAWDAGEDLFWDPTPGELTNVSATGHMLVGHASAAAASADATATVVLHGTATALVP